MELTTFNLRARYPDYKNRFQRKATRGFAESHIDLAVFWDRDDIDGFDEDVLLRKLCWDVDLRIEPHSFARTDFDETDPYIRDIIETGERIL